MLFGVHFIEVLNCVIKVCVLLKSVTPSLYFLFYLRVTNSCRNGAEFRCRNVQF